MDFSIPLKREVLAEISKLKKLMSKCKTVEDARAFEEKFDLYIEVNHCDLVEHCTDSRFNGTAPEDIEWFRVEDFCHLGYVYFRNGWKEDSRDIYFDIFNDGDDYSVLSDVTENTIDQRYEEWLEQVKAEILR